MRDKVESRENHQAVDGIGVTLIVFSAVILAFGIWAVWRIFDPVPTTTDDLRVRIELVRNIGLFVLGVIGLPLAIWRSMTASRQTREAILQGYRVERQLAFTDRQIAATEETNLAKLLQDGAKLLADNDAANVTAGIATLSVVARTDPDLFGNQALTLLIDFVQQKGGEGHTGANIKRAITALQTAYDLRPAQVADHLIFVEDYETSARYDDYETNWRLVRGARTCTYVGGDFAGQAFKENLDGFRFRHLVFRHCDIERMAALSMENCSFKRCRFKEIDCGSLTRSTLKDCNLSGVRIVINGPIPDLRAGQNYFEPESPPLLVGCTEPVDLLAILFQGRPQPDDAVF
ncbi:hypothetical protein [Mesorhizobium sp. ANAO-SY3R2]|uniref:hypothetical protein n=1 Tax=Mesorhizobium sp. ANAO-SY3R2 TaxID=3166644 RepID=UPI00366C4EF7